MDNKRAEERNTSDIHVKGLNPLDLMCQGLNEDTLQDLPVEGFDLPSLDELTKLFPQFEILELLGHGGMGAVYKARQLELDRMVALKILPHEIGAVAGFSEQFSREARALAKMNHSGIVTLYEFGEVGGVYYIVMEYVDGANLQTLIQHGRISSREALAIVSQICDALQYAHDLGIVHRDIKPQNILVSRDGKVKVADFGIAKLIAREQNEIINKGSSSKDNETGFSYSGKVVGTPPYMAPEQLSEPFRVDHRADIYALGVVLYQLLTGKLPECALDKSPSEIIRLDVKLDEVVLRALANDPERRYQQANEMKTGVQGAVVKSDGSKARRFPFMIWMILLFACLGAAVYWMRGFDGREVQKEVPALMSVFEEAYLTDKESLANLIQRRVSEEYSIVSGNSVLDSEEEEKLKEKGLNILDRSCLSFTKSGGKRFVKFDRGDCSLEIENIEIKVVAVDGKALDDSEKMNVDSSKVESETFVFTIKSLIFENEVMAGEAYRYFADKMTANNLYLFPYLQKKGRTIILFGNTNKGWQPNPDEVISVSNSLGLFSGEGLISLPDYVDIQEGMLRKSGFFSSSGDYELKNIKSRSKVDHIQIRMDHMCTDKEASDEFDFSVEWLICRSLGDAGKVYDAVVGERRAANAPYEYPYVQRCGYYVLSFGPPFSASGMWLKDSLAYTPSKEEILKVCSAMKLPINIDVFLGDEEKDRVFALGESHLNKYSSAADAIVDRVPYGEISLADAKMLHGREEVKNELPLEEIPSEKVLKASFKLEQNARTATLYLRAFYFKNNELAEDMYQQMIRFFEKDEKKQPEFYIRTKDNVVMVVSEWENWPDQLYSQSYQMKKDIASLFALLGAPEEVLVLDCMSNESFKGQ